MMQTQVLKFIFTVVIFIVFFYYLIKREKQRNTNIISINHHRRKQPRKKKPKDKVKVLYTRTFKNDFTNAHINANWEEIEKHF